MAARPHFMHFGPPMPVVPVGDFSPMRLTAAEWAQAWSVCGPSVEKNMRQGGELWQIITAAWLEGLALGAGLAERRALLTSNQESGHE